MRRFASILAIALVVVGLELSTKVVSLASGRIGSGFSAIMNGLDFHVSLVRFSGGVALVCIGSVIWVVATWLAFLERRMARAGDRCPSCKAGTHRVKRTKAQKTLERVMGLELSARRCGDCGWSGLALKY